MVSKEQIDEIVSSTDMVALVSPYVKLTKSGSGFKGLCPFHNENTPSFMVSQQKKIAKCMGCGEGGSPIKFLQKIKNISFMEALQELADKAGIELRGYTKEYTGPDYSHYYEIMETAHKFFRYNLLNTKSGEDAIAYLENRGLDRNTIEAFEIGLAPSDNDSLYQVLKQAGYNELDMCDLGLIKNGNRNFYDLFKNRIMFPVKDEQGHIIAFSGRIYHNEAEQAKYVNSPETIIFKKGQSLFHLYDAMSDIRKSHRAVLHEGQMDVIASYNAGIKESICSMGTALTKEQVQIINKYAKEVIICYDGDNAGLNAMMKAIKLFDTNQTTLNLVMLPDKMDPDEFVKKNGKEEFLKYFENNKITPADYIIKYATKDKDFTSLSDIEQIKKIVFEFLNNKSSQIEVDYVFDELSRMMNISKASLMIDFHKDNNISPIITDNNYKNEYQTDFIDDSFDFNFNYQNNLDVSQSYNTFDFNFIKNHARAELRLLNYGKISKEFALRIENHELLDKPFIDYLEPINQNIWTNLIDDYYITHQTFNENEFYHSLDSNCKNAYKFNIDSLNNNLDYLNEYSEEDLEECIKALILSEPKKEIDMINNNFDYLPQSEKLSQLIKKIEKLKQVQQSTKKTNESRN